jgi:NADH:ubiquinone oxidoreductase subunit D
MPIFINDDCHSDCNLDVLQYNTSIRIIDHCGQTSSRPLASTKTHKIHSHNTGEEVLSPLTEDYELVTNADFVRIEVIRGRWISIKIGDTTAEPYKVKTFEYNGEPKNFYVSNKDDMGSVTIKYVTAKYKK